MELLKILILGIVQGITEFLPISSDGHLALFQHFLKFDGNNNLLFDVLLHFGTVAAIIIVYFKRILQLLAELFKLIGVVFKGKFTLKNASKDRFLLLFLVLSLLPLFLILPFKKTIEGLYSNIIVVGLCLLLTALLLFLADRATAKPHKAKPMNGWDALLIGFAQALAPLPGLSRSGSTISMGLLRGLSREAVVEFSFLMSVPAVLAANVVSIKDAMEQHVVFNPQYLWGMLLAAGVGFFAIKLVRLLVKNNKLIYFAYYCTVLGLFSVAAGIFGL